MRMMEKMKIMKRTMKNRFRHSLDLCAFVCFA